MMETAQELRNVLNSVKLVKSKEVPKNPRLITSKHFFRRAIQFSLSAKTHQRELAMVTSYLSLAYQVQEDEIAILLLDRTGKTLHFVAPNYLAHVKASIPYGRRTALASEALWERRVYIMNQLPSVPHCSQFEKVTHLNPNPFPLEKVLTYPIVCHNSPLGVIQVSRKKLPFEVSIPDFQQEDVHWIAEIHPAICRLLQGIRSSSPSLKTAAPRD